MAKPLIICFAGDRWDGNPHSRHHLMRRFAGDFEVLFVESLPMRSFAAVGRQELWRAWSKLRKGIAMQTVAPHIHVLRPPPIPPAGWVGRRAQLTAARAQIAWARRRLGLFGASISWFSVPIAAPLRGRLHERASLFYYQDRYDAFSHVDSPRLRALVADLARGCDACIATSDELAADLARDGADPVVIAHGVDLERFARDLPPPADLGGLERPLVGYVGLLDDYVSFESIRAVADELATGTVVLVGDVNTDVSSLEHPRIARLGFRPYECIPAYLASFDCCLLPFKLNRLTVAVNPIKLREYLAAGRPVVATPLPPIVAYGDVVEFAEDPEHFAGAVARTLSSGQDSREARVRRRQRVAGESWDTVAQRIRPILDELLGQPGHALADPPGFRART